MGIILQNEILIEIHTHIKSKTMLNLCIGTSFNIFINFIFVFFLTQKSSPIGYTYDKTNAGEET